jgi:hypothetical protein
MRLHKLQGAMTRFMYIDKTINRFVPFVLLADRSMRAGQKGKKGRKAKVHKSFPFIHSAHHCFHLTWRSVLRLLTTLLDQQQGSYSICQRIFNFFGYFSNHRTRSRTRARTRTIGTFYGTPVKRIHENINPRRLFSATRRPYK